MLMLLMTVAAACLAPPVDAPVIDPFRMPACEYCPGNRGIEYGPEPGQTVRAVAAGAVRFAGTVAGTRWVTVQHGDGLTASYGRLSTIALSEGDDVTAGQLIGTTTDELYFGLRDGDRPVDPTPLLGTIRYPTRLVPPGGVRRRAVGAGRLVCRNSIGAG
jgi:murein DD-endopeptidase MepM/ murein hydrolase activator NlpD